MADFIVKDTTDSTKADLKALSRDGAPHGTVVVSKTQSLGRGRLGRAFSSPEGGLYMSVLVDLPRDMDQALLITAKAAVAVRRAVLEICDVNLKIKWVNDLYLHGRKVCGILSEVVRDKVVVGVGLNYCTRQSLFQDDVRRIATSLYDGPSEDLPDMMLLAQRIKEHLVSLAQSQDRDFLDECRDNNLVLRNEVDVIRNGKTVASGKAYAIDDKCFLHVQTTDGELVLSTGEVSIRLACH